LKFQDLLVHLIIYHHYNLFLSIFLSIFLYNIIFYYNLYFFILYYSSIVSFIVPFLTISSILIDVCFSNLIFIGAIFNQYNYWYLLSYSNQYLLHYSILFIPLLIDIILYLYIIHHLSIIFKSSKIFNSFYYFILYSYFYNFSFFIPIFSDSFLIFSIFFFKGLINGFEVIISFNLCYSMWLLNFFSLFFHIQLFCILIIIILSSFKFWWHLFFY